MKYPKKEPVPIPPAIIYARFSPRPYEPRVPKSIETQVSFCMDYAKIHDMEVIGTFKDEYATGGQRSGRPGFEDALTLAKERKGVLLVYDLSRFARNARDAMNCAEELKEAGAHLASVKDNIDTSSAIGRCFFTVISAFNELEREKTAGRTRDAMVELQRRGRRVGRYPPYGWSLDPNNPAKPDKENPARIIPNEVEQETAKIIVQLRDAGLIWRKIAEELRRRGLKPRGPAWRQKLLEKVYRRAQIGI